MPLNPSQLIYCKRTKTRGRGVFATKAIKAGTEIERVPVLVMSVEHLYSPKGTSMLGHYVFHWSDGKVALALGYGSLYNHSYTPNMRCDDLPAQTKRFIALRDIAADEELTFNYAGSPEAKDPVGFEVK